MLAVSWWGEERGWIYSQYNEASSGVIIFFNFYPGQPVQSPNTWLYAVICCCFHVRLELMAIFLSHRKVFLLHKQLDDELSYFILQL